VKYYTNKARQAGMTLIELTVVLLVLVGLAGLLIPYVSGFVTKTHDSTGSSNIQALNNAMARYQVEHYDRFPDQMDSLLEVDGGGTSVVYTKMMSSLMPMMGMNYLSALQIDAAKAKALNDVGVNNLMVMDSTTGDATFRNTVALPAAVNAGTFVAEISGAAVLNDLGTRMGTPTDPSVYHYLAFGVGDDSKIVGQTVSQVPVHFAANGDMGANNAYNHFVAIFEVLKQDACVVGVSGWASVYSPDLATASDGDPSAVVVAGIVADTGGTVIAPTSAELSGAANQADCLALNTAAAETGVAWTGADASAVAITGTGGQWDYTGVEWKTAGSDKARFIGTAMAMGMNNLEGLGGALTRYYNNQVSN